MVDERERRKLPVIGWREWLELPDLGVTEIKVKIDTGARSSSLHAFDMEIFRRDEQEWVRFKIHPLQRDVRQTVTVEAPVIEWRTIRNSGGQTTRRPIIVTRARLMDVEWPIEVS